MQYNYMTKLNLARWYTSVMTSHSDKQETCTICAMQTVLSSNDLLETLRANIFIELNISNR